jgi:hypothetical protein
VDYTCADENAAAHPRADDLPTYVDNLNRVERDLFDLPPTEIDLPPWVG